MRCRPLYLLAVLTTGCGQPVGPLQRAPTDRELLGAPFVIERRVGPTGDHATLHATFKNKTGEPLRLIVRKMDVNLFEPLDGLPATLVIAPRGQSTLALDYPKAAAAPKTAAERSWVPPMEGVDPNGPSLNYTVDMPSNGRSSGSFELNEMPEPSPAVVSGAGINGLAFVNDRFERGMEVRLLGLEVGGREKLKKPLQLRLPQGVQVTAQGVALPARTPDGIYAYPVVVKYAYRLIPNREWRFQTMNLQ